MDVAVHGDRVFVAETLGGLSIWQCTADHTLQTASAATRCRASPSIKSCSRMKAGPASLPSVMESCTRTRTAACITSSRFHVFLASMFLQRMKESTNVRPVAFVPGGG